MTAREFFNILLVERGKYILGTKKVQLCKVKQRNGMWVWRVFEEMIRGFEFGPP